MAMSYSTPEASRRSTVRGWAGLTTSVSQRGQTNEYVPWWLVGSTRTRTSAVPSSTSPHPVHVARIVAMSPTPSHRGPSPGEVVVPPGRLLEHPPWVVRPVFPTTLRDNGPDPAVPATARRRHAGVVPRLPSLRPPIGFAHRGARAHATENTLEAFRLAVRLGRRRPRERRLAHRRRPRRARPRRRRGRPPAPATHRRDRPGTPCPSTSRPWPSSTRRSDRAWSSRSTSRTRPRPRRSWPAPATPAPRTDCGCATPTGRPRPGGGSSHPR